MCALQTLNLALLLLAVCCHAFQLQDTIHTLIEENIHLHDQLENLTSALRQLRRFLLHHRKDQNHDPDPDLQHLWEEWSQQGVSPESRVLLEHTLCGHELHASASMTGPVSSSLLLLLLLTLQL